ncbi:MAG: 2OG-Fe(II) oxygenase [Flavipsychrobacter sp.]|jgi:SM-20-related protein|nr:2OG-Fe(II) oxygenase [Flavipsychrobacter sp.]
MKEKFEEIVESFIENKVGISEFFLAAQLAVLLKEHIQRLQEDGSMTGAGIGNDDIQQHDRRIRTDKIHWLDKKNKHVEELGFLEYIEDFIDYLNKTCYTGINAYEFHYAMYEEGSFYKRHKDQFRNNDDRKYSLISYLNDDWIEADGGQLWVYQNDETQKILPTSRKAVFFESSELEHEVTMAMRPRMSITGWLKRV